MDKPEECNQIQGFLHKGYFLKLTLSFGLVLKPAYNALLTRSPISRELSLADLGVIINIFVRYLYQQRSDDFAVFISRWSDHTFVCNRTSKIVYVITDCLGFVVFLQLFYFASIFPFPSTFLFHS